MNKKVKRFCVSMTEQARNNIVKGIKDLKKSGKISKDESFSGFLTQSALDSIEKLSTDLK